MSTSDTTGRWVRAELREASEPSIPIDLIALEAREADFSAEMELLLEEDTAPSTEASPEKLAALRDLEVMVSNAKTTAKRAQLLETIAEGYDDVGRRRAAAHAWKRLVQIDPTHEHAFGRVEEALCDEGAFDALVDLYLARVEVLRGRDRIALIRRAAAVLEDHLDDPAQALEALTLAWTLDPTAKETSAALDRLAAQTGSYEELVRAAESELARGPARVVRVAIQQQCAGWYTALGRHDEAKACLEAVLAEQPGDADALAARARALEANGSFEELADTLVLLARAQPTRREEADVYVALGDLHAERLGSPEEAAAAYVAAVRTVPHHELALSKLDALYTTALDPAEDGPDDVEPLRALAQHHERNNDYAAAVRAMRRLAAVLPSHHDRVSTHVRTARTYETKLGDADGALEHWYWVVEAAPMHREANAAVRRIHGERGDWAAVVRSLEAEAERTDEDARRATLHVEAAKLYEEALGDTERAWVAYQRAVDADPSQLEAAVRLAKLHSREGRYERAYELLAPLSKELHRQSMPVKRDVRLRLGEAAFAIGRDDEAIVALSAAAEGGAPARALLALVIACFRRERWDDAASWARALVSQHGEDALVREKHVEIHHMLGVAENARGDIGAAARAFREVLSRSPEHRPTLEALIALEEKRERWEAAAALREHLAACSESPEERAKRLMELGDVCMQRLSQVPRALQVYEQAADEQPEDRRVLHKLLDAYQKAERWAEALSVIARIQALEPRPDVRAKYAYTAGVILRDELRDGKKALEWFHEALAIDPTFLKAFAAIDAMLTKAQAWPQLERSYRKALKGVVGTGNPDLEFQLWHNLGLVYRDRLHDHTRAIEAFRMSSRLQPDNREEHRILAELFTSVGRGREETAADHQAILDQDPSRVGSYHALFEIHARTGDHARARAAAAALAFMGEADATEREYLERVGPPVLSASRSMHSEHWAHLHHPDLRPELSVIFEALVGPLRKLRARPDAELGLLPAERVEKGGSSALVAQLFFGLSRYMRLPMHPRLFVSKTRRGGLVHVGYADPPASFCGATPLSGFTTPQLEFLVAHHLADYTTELAIRTMLRTPSELAAALRTAMAMTGHGDGASQSELVERLATEIDRNRVPGLRQTCAALADKDLDRTALRWAAAADVTAARTAFLVCNDLAAASLILRDLPAPPSGLTVQYILTDLTRFSVSDTYFTLLADLGSR